MSNYKKNFITESILRIDFYTPIDELQKSLPDDFENEILKTFPIMQKNEILAGEVLINSSSKSIESTKRVQYNEWFFWGNGKTKKLAISKDYYLVMYKKYTNFDDFKASFLLGSRLINKNYADISIKRIGMRYINQIRINEKNPLSWNKYLNSNLLCAFKINKEKSDITRSFHDLELKFDDEDINLKFQYGMHNPDFPSKIKQKLFILDFDANKKGILSFDEIEYLLPVLHEKIENIFETSIKDGLRKIMNE